MDQDIITHMRQRYNLLIGERMAEEAKFGIVAMSRSACGAAI